MAQTGNVREEKHWRRRRCGGSENEMKKNVRERTTKVKKGRASEGVERSGS